MSLAESHAAGGEGREEGSGGDGEGMSQVKGEEGLLSGLSLSVIMMIQEGNSDFNGSFTQSPSGSLAFST